MSSAAALNLHQGTAVEVDAPENIEPEAAVPVEVRRLPGALASSSAKVEEPVIELDDESPPDASRMAAIFATVTQLNYRAQSSSRADVRARWIGTVQRVAQDHFTAILADQDDPLKPREVAEFDREIVAKSDVPLLAVGAVFYFSVGYRTDERGTRTAFSEVRFRRLPVWTVKEIESLASTDDVDHLFE